MYSIASKNLRSREGLVSWEVVSGESKEKTDAPGEDVYSLRWAALPPTALLLSSTSRCIHHRGPPTGRGSKGI